MTAATLPKGWTEVALGDVAAFRYGKALAAGSRSGSGAPVFGSNGEVGRHDRSLTNGPTILIGRKGSFGEVNFSKEPCWPIDTTYFVDAESASCDLRWLYHCLSTLGLKELNRSAAVPGLNREDAYRKRILLPPIDEQRRIAAVLDQADALRAKCGVALALLDTLTESIFLDMFGDPVRNPMSWPDRRQLGDIAHIGSGITKGRKVGVAATRPVPYLAVANVQDQTLALDAVKTIDATEDEIRRYRLEVGDLLLTEGGDPDKLGRGTVWNAELDECIHQNHIFRVRITSHDLEPLFVSKLLASPRGRRYFLGRAKQTTGIASINKTQLSEFPMLTPPVELQRTFVARLRRHQRETAQAERVASAMDDLFASLQQRAFRGEL